MAAPKILAKIAALLRKAEGTTNEHEASAFMAKAQELMVTYAVEQADLPSEQRETVGGERFNVASLIDAVVVNAVALANGCRAIRHSKARGSGASGIDMTVVGTPSDIAFVRALVASVVLQRESALTREEWRRPYTETARTWNQAFRLGYCERVARRLQEARQRAEQADSSAPGTAVVLVNRDRAAVERFRELFPRATSARGPSASGSGRAHGQRAGASADLSGGRNNLRGSRAALTR